MAQKRFRGFVLRESVQNAQQPFACFLLCRGHRASKGIFHKVFPVQPAQNAQYKSCAKLHICDMQFADAVRALKALPKL